MQKGLALPAATTQVARLAVLAQLRHVPLDRDPALDLPLVVLDSAAHVISAVPLEPPSRIFGVDPAFGDPIREWLRGRNTKEIEARVRAIGAELRVLEPVGGKLGAAVGHVFSTEHSQGQHVSGRQFGFEPRVKPFTWCADQLVGVDVLHFVIDRHDRMELLSHLSFKNLSCPPSINNATRGRSALGEAVRPCPTYPKMPRLNAMKGVVLAAGKGSRLYPVTHHVPKPLLPICNRMTMEYAFDQLRDCGVKEVCVVVGSNEPQVRAALGDGSQFNLALSYVKQTEPKGLAHAVGFAKEFVAGDSFILYLGDAVYSQPLRPFVDKFRQSGCANLNLVKEVADPSRFGVANVSGDRITRLVEKPKNPESNLAMAGMYVFGPKIWDVLPNLQPSGRGEYEITDAIQILVDQGETVLAGKYEGEWFDTGTLDSFLETSGHLCKGGSLIGEGAVVNAEVGENVVIGANAQVTATSLSDCVILPGSKVTVTGQVAHSLLGGHVKSKECVNVVAFNDERGP